MLKGKVIKIAEKKKVFIALIFIGLLLSSFVGIAYGSSCNFVGSKKSDVYHYPDCRYVKNIKPENRICFDTPEEAIAKGYRPCKVCKPPTSSIPELTPTPLTYPPARTLPAEPVPAGESFAVTIEVSDYGMFGHVDETLPKGFFYITSTHPPGQVRLLSETNTVRFVLFGETSFTYTMTAPNTENTYTFSGVLKAEDKNEYKIGGDTEIVVGEAKTTPSPTLSPSPTYHKWIEKADTPEAGGYGEAVVGADNYIYIARCLYASSTPYFWHYDPTTDGWDSMNTSGLPTGAFRNGVALTWDNESYIYALLGGRYSDTNRRLFYRYSISNNSWEQLIDTPHAQGAGDAITWSGYDSNIYGIMGSKGHGTDFAYYNISTNSWNALPFNPNWTTTDDGASLTWTGGEYLYALRGEWQETVPCQDFARYYIPTKIWEDMEDIPESEGVGDGASLLWVDEYPGYIFALGGGSCLEDPGYNFYRNCSISSGFK